MITIDGSQKSGSGTILRYAVSLSTLLGEPLRIYNIRAKRKKPGLRPQHLRSVMACAKLCDGEVGNAKVGASEIKYYPKSKIKGGYYDFDIGTAGSTTMLTLTLLPVALFASKEVNFSVTGGVVQDFAPSVFHMQQVLFPTLKKMGIQASLFVEKMGYVPKGQGRIKVRVLPIKSKIRPIVMLEQGIIQNIEGIAVSSHLERQRVSERMRKACCDILTARGYEVKIKEVNDYTSVQPGAALAVWAQNENCILGMDRAGKIGRRAESIGAFVARNLLADISAESTVDRFLADQLILYGGLACGETKYKIPIITPHIETNLWLVEEILGAKTKLEDNIISIKGIGYI